LPALREEINEIKEQLRERDERVKTLEDQLARLRRVYEHLLILASEAGVSPTELESMQNNLIEDDKD
jgi:predicted RNase H-like nuclease (RuvC/YqgF family)